MCKFGPALTELRCVSTNEPILVASIDTAILSKANLKHGRSLNDSTTIAGRREILAVVRLSAKKKGQRRRTDTRRRKA